MTHMKTLFTLVLLLINVGHTLADTNETQTTDVSFTAVCDGTEQRYVLMLPAGFEASQSHDLLIALHGHGSDRWQFINDPQEACRATREAALARGMIYVSPDYRAPTSWMGPKAEADLVQIISSLKKEYRVLRVFLCGGSMGATGSLTFAVLHPDLIDGVVAINPCANLVAYEGFQDAIQASYGGTKKQVFQEYKNRSPEYWPERLTMPVGMTLGGKDETIPPDSALRLGKVLETLKSPVKVIYRAEAGHTTDYKDCVEVFDFVLGPPLQAGGTPPPPAQSTANPTKEP